MANRDDVSRELAECADCGAVYAARQWPDGTIKAIGSESCRCGSTEFELVESDEGSGLSNEPHVDGGSASTDDAG
ncbi:hypothetical protein GWG54_17740 [Natronococcus sp. JC468]|uniref:hypothetical protein n=1 Tax=Natronococcus sp. JC468 TaxID=1961921 RepID=UPI00143C24C1|nr:hypothetical protein [Natronococcus sp. JC468]NKE37612.1 hypothetical protein [Natronococcus sp. JC468]